MRAFAEIVGWLIIVAWALGTTGAADFTLRFVLR